MELKNLRADTQSIRHFILVSIIALVMAACVTLTAYTNAHASLICDDPINGTSECPNDTVSSADDAESGSNLLVGFVFGAGVLIAVATIVLITRQARKAHRTRPKRK